jgi:hypothetical protein
VPRRPEISYHHVPGIRAFLATLSPEDELTYRLALFGMFPQLRGREWQKRRDELMAELALTQAKVGRFMARAAAMKDRIAFIISEM